MNATQLIHAIPVDELTGAVSVPIYQTSTFVQQSPGVNKGFDYARTGNPTRKALEDLMAAAEGGSTGIAFGSGLAAIDAVVRLLRPGDEIIAVDDIYGGAWRQFTYLHTEYGIKVKYTDTSIPEKVLELINTRTRMIWIESPTNPTLKITDIRSMAAIAGECGAFLVVDNTFASPVLQQPLTLGADIVVHSATKYLGGHSDVIAGLVVTKREDIGMKMRFIQNAAGAILGPFDSWLIIRGMETLHLRVRQHGINAQAVASFLDGHSSVERVFYPGLQEHPNHKVAAGQSKGFGGIVSFVLKENSVEAATAFVTRVKLFKLAESLGGVKSLCCHPATMTHRSIPALQRQEAGVSDGLVRLSVGIEEAEDLVADLENSLKE